MAAPFRFLDRIDALVSGPSSVATAVRELVAPGGDRPVTRASDASRIPAGDVRAHVVGVALDVVRARVRDGLVDALRDHLDEVRAEYELLEGPCPEDGTGSFVRDQWCVNFYSACGASFRGGDLDGLVKDEELLSLNEAEELADAVLLEPIADPGAVLARVGLAAEAIDEIVEMIRAAPQGPRQVDHAGEKLPAGETRDAQPDAWSLRKLAGSWAFTGEPEDAELFREAVTYVLGDPEMIDTGADLLGLTGDAAFLAWARERAAFSDPAQDEADVAEVLRLANFDNRELVEHQPPSGPIDGDGMQGEEPPAAQTEWCVPEIQALLDSGKAVLICDVINDSQEALRRVGDHKIVVVPTPRTPKDVRGSTAAWASARKVVTMQGVVLKDAAAPRPERSPPSSEQESPLTRAAGAALAALYDHGCETDKAMAETLGVQKAVVNQSRHGRTPWAPDDGQRDALLGLVAHHLAALETARDGLLEAFS